MKTFRYKQKNKILRLILASILLMAFVHNICDDTYYIIYLIFALPFYFALFAQDPQKVSGTFITQKMISTMLNILIPVNSPRVPPVKCKMIKLS